MKIKPWLYLPVGWAHYLSPLALKVYSSILPKELVRWKAFSWRNLYFSNPLGTAGGMDKNALHLKEWIRLGAGFLEIGTVTPQPQSAHLGKTLDRSLKYFSLWNNMGFPNKGMEHVREQCLALSKAHQPPLFINIGKNRWTPMSKALEDYKNLMECLHPFASAFVINISSPNTTGLRELFSEKNLPHFLKSLKEFAQQLASKPFPTESTKNKQTEIPLILKISPDEKDTLRIIEQSVEAGIDGWCICNSTKERTIPNLFPEPGGISGKLLASRSLTLLKEVKKYLVDNQIQDKLVISCGGVLSTQDVLERLKEGAHLVQVYSALVFEGPGFFQSVFKEISN